MTRILGRLADRSQGLQVAGRADQGRLKALGASRDSETRDSDKQRRGRLVLPSAPALQPFAGYDLEWCESERIFPSSSAAARTSAGPAGARSPRIARARAPPESSPPSPASA